MGTGASVPTNVVSDPFPIDGATSSRLDLLSTVVNRILSTDDIYDLANLTRGGTCGDYAIFLKENIEKKLKTFVADLGDGKKAVVRYGTSKSSIADPVDRKKICSDLAASMVTVIATVVACLGSIQVATKTRGLGSSVQRGGDIRDVRDWLFKKGFIEPYTDVQRISNLPVQLIVSPRQKARKIGFSLILIESIKTLSIGFLTAKADPEAAPEDQMPPGGFRVHMWDPLPVSAAPATTVMLVRILDAAGAPFSAGVLADTMFQSFVDGTSPRPFADVVEDLFRYQKGDKTVRMEPYDQVIQASEVFDRVRASATPAQVLDKVVGRFLADHVPGYNPQVPFQPPPPQPQFPFLAQQQQLPQLPYQAQQPFQPVQPPLTKTFPLAPSRGLERPIPVLAPVTTQYDIPLASGNDIKKRFDSFKGQVAEKSNPAAARAFALTRAERNRVIQTSVCEDDYWKQPSAMSVHPWGTFYFLCTRDWTKSADVSGAYPQWNEFLDRIASSYATNDIGITLTRGSAEQVRFSDPAKIRGCPALTGSYKDIGPAIVALREAYAAHAKVVWSILDDLIFVVDDPATKTQAVVLHPKVTANNAVATKDYVEERANRARNAIRDFYATVEDIYARAIAAIQKQPSA